ncbi:MAG: tRNA-dihydrouridine synthase family protein [Proteobacteria bacterium]|nr:tRNA-dihydrouridine synthase family protein [Pseudomonadota bacterium]MBU1688174.1 tRNA-dihydrouridine synthase family protein [Pseudomonadota bacterium]
MLAPMQGLTNRALRDLFVKWVRPDVVFTEFIRVRPGSKKPFSAVDRLEAASQDEQVPLVVQLIGRDVAGLSASARAAREEGAVHLNINLGCPYGRMSRESAGGALLKDPTGLVERLLAVREQAEASFSVKVRSGYDHPEQIFSLLPVFDQCGVDFLIIHPRTVTQKFGGWADHAISKRLVEATSLPVIVNGDLNTAETGQAVLAQTGGAGLMFGRGAIADPLLFQRMRGLAPAEPDQRGRAEELQFYLVELLERYRLIFQGERQVLDKLKTVMTMMRGDQFFSREIKKMLRVDQIETLQTILLGLH